MALPAQRVESASLDAGLGQKRGWLEASCGVAARYVCRGEGQEELATHAAQRAMANAGLDAGAVDLIIFAAAVPKQPIPSTAPLIARNLGIATGACTAFDVNSTCLSFLSGLDVAINMLGSGRFRGALVVSSEIATRALPWATAPATAGLFGDGAAAAVLVPPGGNQGGDRQRASQLRAAHFEAFHEGYEFCQLAAGGTGIDFHRDPERFKAGATFQMDGHGLFKLTAKHFPGFVDRLATEGWLAAAGTWTWWCRIKRARWRCAISSSAVGFRKTKSSTSWPAMAIKSRHRSRPRSISRGTWDACHPAPRSCCWARRLVSPSAAWRSRFSACADLAFS